MAQQIGSMYASMSLESASFISGLERATKATNRASTAIEQGMSRASAAVKTFAAVYVADKAIDGAKKYLELADTSKTLEAQLKLATAQFGNQGVAMRQTREIAKETNSGLQETVSLYAKMLPAARDLGKGQDDAARATETFSKALKIGGADTNAAASATLQFGQALASGVLRGDEFNSINEASPRIMRLLADSMGVPVGAMRKMAEEGKLTSEVLFKALTDQKFTKGIDQEFKELPKTFEQAKTSAMNAATDIIGAFERGSGISTAIVNAMGEGTDAVEDLVSTAEAAGGEMRANFEALGTAFQPFLDSGNNAFDVLGIRVASFHEQMKSIFNGMDQLRNFLPDLQRKAQAWDEKHLGFRTGFTGNVGPRSNMEGDYERGYQNSRRQTARQRAVTVIRQNGSERDFTGKGLTDQQIADRANKLARDIVAGRAGRATPGSGRPVPRPPAGKKPGGGSGKSAADKAARDAERQVEKDRKDLEAFTGDMNRSKREELDSATALASTATQRFEFERQALEQDRKSRMDQIDKDGPKGSKRYNEKQVEELKAIEERIDANKRQSVDLKEAEFNGQEQLKLASSSLANAQEMAQLQGGLARTAKDRRASDLRLLDLQMQQEKLALDAVIANRDSTDADRKIAQARLALLPTLRAAQGKQIEQQTMGPLASYLDQIPKTSDEINEALQNVQVNGLDSLQSGLLDAIKGVGSLGDAFGSMADAVIDGLLKIALQQMLIKPLGNLLFGGGGGGGGGGLFGSVVAGITGAVTGKKGITGKANGGMGNRGRYLVGEHGPEYLDVGGPFHVTPNSKLDSVRGGNTPSMSVTFGAITSNDPAAVKAMATQAIAEMMPMINQNAANHTLSKLQRPRM